MKDRLRAKLRQRIPDRAPIPDIDLFAWQAREIVRIDRRLVTGRADLVARGGRASAKNEPIMPPQPVSQIRIARSTLGSLQRGRRRGGHAVTAAMTRSRDAICRSQRYFASAIARALTAISARRAWSRRRRTTCAANSLGRRSPEYPSLGNSGTAPGRGGGDARQPHGQRLEHLVLNARAPRAAAPRILLLDRDKAACREPTRSPHAASFRQAHAPPRSGGCRRSSGLPSGFAPAPAAGSRCRTTERHRRWVNSP